MRCYCPEMERKKSRSFMICDILGYNDNDQDDTTSVPCGSSNAACDEEDGSDSYHDSGSPDGSNSKSSHADGHEHDDSHDEFESNTESLSQNSTGESKQIFSQLMHATCFFVFNGDLIVFCCCLQIPGERVSESLVHCSRMHKCMSWKGNMLYKNILLQTNESNWQAC